MRWESESLHDRVLRKQDAGLRCYTMSAQCMRNSEVEGLVMASTDRGQAIDCSTSVGFAIHIDAIATSETESMLLSTWSLFTIAAT